MRPAGFLDVLVVLRQQVEQIQERHGVDLNAVPVQNSGQTQGLPADHDIAGPKITVDGAMKPPAGRCSKHQVIGKSIHCALKLRISGSDPAVTLQQERSIFSCAGGKNLAPRSAGFPRGLAKERQVIT